MYVAHLQLYIAFASTAAKKVIPREKLASGIHEKLPEGKKSGLGDNIPCMED